MIFPVPSNPSHPMIITNWAMKFHPSGTHKSEISFSCVTPRHIWHCNFASPWCSHAAVLPVLLIPGTEAGAQSSPQGRGAAADPAAVQQSTASLWSCVSQDGVCSPHSCLKQPRSSQDLRWGLHISFQWVFVVDNQAIDPGVCYCWLAEWLGFF